MIGRATGADSVLTNSAYWRDLLFQRRTVAAAAVLGLWIALFVAAWVSNSRALEFAWLFLMLTAIPVAFIPGAALHNTICRVRLGVSPVEVRVSDLPTHVSLKIGWPGQVNRHRVDFRIPKGVTLGDAG